MWDVVLAGIAGAAGLIPIYEALLKKKDVALANKEILVMAGELIMPHRQKHKGEPAPSGQRALCSPSMLERLRKARSSSVGFNGLRGTFSSQKQTATGTGHCRRSFESPHLEYGAQGSPSTPPPWMNKGLEVIEAHHLFGVKPDRISIVIHPQSIIHSMVEFIDGTVLAQMSITDMRAAILYALAYPDRWNSNLPRLDLLSLAALEFHAPDTDKFPCIRLAYQALNYGQTYPTALNAANESRRSLLLGSVSAFLLHLRGDRRGAQPARSPCR